MKKYRISKHNYLVIYMFVIFLFFLIREVSAATYYVSPDGNDSNSGSKSAPFRTIQKAANIVNPGDTVIVANGVYNHVQDYGEDGKFVLRIRRGGTSNAWVTFKAENTWGAKIDGQNSVDFCVLFDYPGSPGYIRFEGFDIYNCCNSTTKSGDAIFVNARKQSNCDDAHTHNIYLYKNKIHDVCRLESNKDYGQAGIDMDRCAGPLTIDSCVFYNIGRLNPDTTPSAPESSCTVPYGYPYSPPSTGTCTKPSGCVFCYNHDPAIYPRGSDVTIINNIFYPDIASGWPIQPYPLFGDISNLKIINNTFYGRNNHTSYHITLPYEAYKIRDVLIQNNIFHSPRTAAIRYNSVASVTVKNNLVYDGALVADAGCSASNYICSGNLTGQGPKFVDLPNRDFHLQSTSPAIDKGLVFPARTKDADGNSIVGLPDIGAYEYVGAPSGDTVPPAPPTIIKIE
ncbi:MAG: DUF1565 domain-containing protein [Thermodesulfovibrionales bacterium]